MGLLARIFGTERPALETRGDVYIDPYWSNWVAMGNGGGLVSPDITLSNLAVASRCVGLRSESIANMPLHLYRRTGDGRERASDNALYSVLHDNANSQQSAYEFRELMVRSLDLWGNSYSKIERNQRGQVTALYPLLNGDVQVDKLPSGRLRYRVYSNTARRTEIYLQEEILHVRGPSRDGILGLSPISIARGALSLALQHSETAQAFSKNSFRPSGMVSFPGVLSPDQRTAYRDTVTGLYAGASNAGKVMITDGGAVFKEMSFSPEDSQFLEQRRLANEDVARIFGCPPTSVGLVDRATYSNVEMEGHALVQNCIGPLAGRIETAMQRCLLTDAGRRSLYVEFDLSGLMRGDTVSRFNAYRIGRECGALSANDIRRLENMPPIPEGDGYNQPANWAPLGSTTPAPGAPAS